VALVSVIRRWHLRDGVPIREIVRRTGLSRNTVRKYLASQDLEPAYPARKSPSKLDDYEESLTNWLFRESRRHRKKRRTVKQLYRDLPRPVARLACQRIARHLQRRGDTGAQRIPSRQQACAQAIVRRCKAGQTTRRCTIPSARSRRCVAFGSGRHGGEMASTGAPECFPSGQLCSYILLERLRHPCRWWAVLD
jgi:hypothetical protein